MNKIKFLNLLMLPILLSGCSNKNAYNARWLVGEGSPSDVVGILQGQRYLDMSSFDLHQFLGGKWKVIDNIKDDGTTPTSNIKSVAHRGYSMAAPENTLAAYSLAAIAGFKYAECDVSFTKDNVPVLLHDDTIDRTSNGKGKISSLTYEEAASFDYGSWRSPYFKDEKLPTFDEFISQCVELDIHPYIELKGSMTDEQLDILLSIVNSGGLIDECKWISFNKGYLKSIKEKDNTANLGYLVHSINNEVINYVLNDLSTESNEVNIGCNISNLNADMVTMCKNKDIPLEVWTLNSEDSILSLDPYISGVTSDYLLAHKVINEK